MRLIFIFKLLFIILIVSSCNQQTKKIPIDLFNIQNLDNIKAKSFNNFDLNSQGYNRIVVDLLTYEKKENDTVVQLEFDMNSGLILTKSWLIKLDNSEISSIKSYLQDTYGVIEISGYSNYDEKSDSYYFSVIKQENNAIFFCSVQKELDENYLKIIYFNSIQEN